MGEIRDAILKIVKSDKEIGNALQSAKVPGKIRSLRGIAYIGDDGGSKSKKVIDPSNGENTGAPGATQETDPANPSWPTPNMPGGSGTGVESPWVEQSRTTSQYTLPVPPNATDITIEEAATITFSDPSGNLITLQFTTQP